MANEIARAEIERAIKRAEKRLAAAHLRLEAMAEEVGREKKLAGAISSEISQLTSTLDTLGGPVPKPEKPEKPTEEQEQE